MRSTLTALIRRLPSVPLQAVWPAPSAPSAPLVEPTPLAVRTAVDDTLAACDCAQCSGGDFDFDQMLAAVMAGLDELPARPEPAMAAVVDLAEWRTRRAG
jgi:hypothetical protein